MIDYIYALVETESRIKFYIGRTEDPKRRIREHRYGAKNYQEGDELKYLYAYNLNKLGVQWDMEILAECDQTTEFYEDYFVNLYRHEPLQNMRAGDSEPWMGRNYESFEDFIKAKEFCEQAAKAQQDLAKLREKRRIYRPTDVEQTLYSFEDPNKKFVSPWMKERIKNGKKS